MKQYYIKNLLLVLCLFLGMNTSAETTAIVDGLKYSFEGNNAYVIGYDEATIPGYLVIPETVSFNGLTFHVTEIRKNSFTGCSKIKSLATNENIATIGEYAFQNCLNLKEVNIYAISIYSNAFANCSNLETLTLDGVLNIYDSAFSGCTKMKWIDFGKSLKRIGHEAFKNCSSLTCLVFPESLELICANNSTYSYFNDDYYFYKYDCWGNKLYGDMDAFSRDKPNYYPYVTHSPFIGCSLIQSVK